MVMGSVRSTGEPGIKPKNSAGVTPTMTKVLSPNETDFPMTAGSEPKRRRHYLSLMTATGGFKPSSAEVINRPSRGFKPRSSK